MTAAVKHEDQPVRTTKVSRKNQVTLPVAALREAGVAAGDVLRVEVEAPGVFRLVRAHDPWWELFQKFQGSNLGITTREELEEMRDEWDR
ncbi:AbrB/MazE/SpoVT family DNA-binding domain-containing protein [Pseudonocardia spinosispora]|uniref:AbrB/MazE/SpoVT family DNA-binding domain-containing protein n=1 Tax=Pseudonocardia spinosispora TaxID=103441 RepID=UPI00048C51A3|nr:AbrB/MazE/SpoVT family DNA-binding domain-containing protein [Pseudonocardia spinosispora]